MCCLPHFMQLSQDDGNAFALDADEFFHSHSKANFDPHLVNPLKAFAVSYSLAGVTVFPMNACRTLDCAARSSHWMGLLKRVGTSINGVAAPARHRLGLRLDVMQVNMAKSL